MSATVKTAQQALDDARAKVTEWEAKALAARSEAATLEGESGAAILADPSVADGIATRIHAQQMTARVYDGAAAEAREQVKARRRELLEAWAAHYDRDAAKAAKARDEHKAKIDALLGQIRELDGGHPWKLEAEEPKLGGPGVIVSKLRQLAGEARNLLNSAAYCRYVLAEGAYPQGPSHLRDHGGDAHWFEDLGMGEVLESTPQAALEYMAELERERLDQRHNGTAGSVPRDPDRPVFLTDGAR